MPTWTFEQGNAGTSNVLAFSSDVKAGSLLVVSAGGDGTSAISAPTDSRGNSWTLIRQVNDATNNYRVAWWMAVSQDAGPCTVTLQDLDPGSEPELDDYTIQEWSVDSGLLASVDVETGRAADHTTATDNVSSGSVTPNVNDVLLLGLAVETGAPTTFTVGTGYTERVRTNLDGVAAAPVVGESRTLATPSSVAATLTASANGRATCLIAAFKATVPPEIAFDAATESVRTATTDPYTFDHTGRAEASGGVQGVALVAIHGASSTDHITGVTYGGVALTRTPTAGLADLTAADTVTEQGRTDIWWIGSGLSGKGGTQTVSVDLASATGDDIEFVCITLYTDDGSDIEILDSDRVQENAANPSVTLTYGGRFGIAIAGLYGGGASPASFTPNANCVEVASQDLGNFYGFVLRQTTPGTADFTIGGTAASDDVAYVAAAFAKVVAAEPVPRYGVVSFQDPAIV